MPLNTFIHSTLCALLFLMPTLATATQVQNDFNTELYFCLATDTYVSAPRKCSGYSKKEDNSAIVASVPWSTVEQATNIGLSPDWLTIGDVEYFVPSCTYEEGASCHCNGKRHGYSNVDRHIPALILELIEDQRSFRSVQNRVAQFRSEGKDFPALVENLKENACRQLADIRVYQERYDITLTALIEEYKGVRLQVMHIEQQQKNCLHDLSPTTQAYINNGGWTSDKAIIKEHKNYQKCLDQFKGDKRNLGRKDRSLRNEVARWLTLITHFPIALEHTIGEEYIPKLKPYH
ncbi:hypothetical protein [Aestuariirhabdus haliotis]|uniref:hypothetical protein n=1 Tax=Aestuariirhabdus haliotis TaxID=2918751 RepID=UPI0020BDDE1C|nr:hypothetical protein [Aestuariirhabdus haliotis]MCL6421619.1 hypothetical protein [Aestuariirhabdus haliotis]